MTKVDWRGEKGNLGWCWFPRLSFRVLTYTNKRGFSHVRQRTQEQFEFIKCPSDHTQ